MKSKYLPGVLLSSLTLSCSKDSDNTTKHNVEYNILSNILISTGLYSSTDEVNKSLESLNKEELDKCETILSKYPNIISKFENSLKKIREKNANTNKEKSLIQIIKELIKIDLKDEKKINEFKIDESLIVTEQKEKTNNDKEKILSNIFGNEMAKNIIEYLSWLNANVKNHDDFYNNIEKEHAVVIKEKITQICETYAKNDQVSMIQYENIVNDINTNQNPKEKILNILNNTFTKLTYDFDSFKPTIELTENKDGIRIVLNYLDEESKDKKFIIEVPVIIANLGMNLCRINFDIEKSIGIYKDSLSEIICKYSPDISTKIISFIEQQFNGIPDNFDASAPGICSDITKSLEKSYKLFKCFIEGKESDYNNLCGYDFETIKKEFKINNSTGEQALYDFVLDKFKTKIENIKSFINSCTSSVELNTKIFKTIFGLDLLKQKGTISTGDNLLAVMNNEFDSKIKYYFPEYVDKNTSFKLEYTNSEQTILSIKISISTDFEDLTSDGNVLIMNSQKTNIFESLQRKIVKDITTKLQEKKYLIDDIITKKQGFIDYITKLESVNSNSVFNVKNDLEYILSPKGSKIYDNKEGLKETDGKNIIVDLLKNTFGDPTQNKELFESLNKNTVSLKNFANSLKDQNDNFPLFSGDAFTLNEIIGKLKTVNDAVKNVIAQYDDFIKKGKPHNVWKNTIKKFILGDLSKTKDGETYEYRLKVCNDGRVPLLIKWMYTTNDNKANDANDANDAKKQQEQFANSVDILLKCFYNKQLKYKNIAPPYNEADNEAHNVNFEDFGVICKIDPYTSINMKYIKEQIGKDINIAKKLSTQIIWNYNYINAFNTESVEIRKIDPFVKTLSNTIKDNNNKINEIQNKNPNLKNDKSWKYFVKKVQCIKDSQNTTEQNAIANVLRTAISEYSDSIPNGSCIYNPDIFGLIGDPKGEILRIYPNLSTRFCDDIDIEKYNYENS